ncbi:MAG: hypothetical protein DRI74_01625 [Bacteroidetes bacterium]|nr:MAG: hypothetical protein DRI74_01625 [Bacteroidota bacterium]
MKRLKYSQFILLLFPLFFLLPSNVLADDKDNEGEFGAIIIPIDSIKKYDSTSFWRLVGRTRLNISTIVLSNWSDGGESSLIGAGSFDLTAIYQKGKIKFENNFRSAIGIQVFQYSNKKKTDDKLELSSILGIQFSEKWFYSFNTNFSSQYYKGYKYPNDTVVVSDFLSPGYLTVSLGLEYKPLKNLSIYASPLAGKITFVNNQDLANEGKYGVVAAVRDSLGNILIEGEKRKSELGISIIAKYKGKINKNLDLNTKLMLYNNYFDPVKSNRWNIDVNWETWFDIIINRFFVASAYFHVIYDHDIKIPVFDMVDGNRIKVGETINLQLKQNYGLGIAFKF